MRVARHPPVADGMWSELLGRMATTSGLFSFLVCDELSTLLLLGHLLSYTNQLACTMMIVILVDKIFHGDDCSPWVNTLRLLYPSVYFWSVQLLLLHMHRGRRLRRRFSLFGQLPVHRSRSPLCGRRRYHRRPDRKLRLRKCFVCTRLLCSAG